MPELPEVETVRRGLGPLLEGRRLTQVVVRRPDLRVPVPANFAARLTGRCVERIDRRGKYLLFHLDDGCVWLAHLGMSGRFRIDGGSDCFPGPHDHLIAWTDDGACVTFHDPRRFGVLDLLEAAAWERDQRLSGLGPEPLSAAFTPAFLAARLKGRRQAVKVVLLNQSVVAGMGNIYASESLFRARLDPEVPGGAVRGRAVARLVAAIRSVLTAAIAAGGSSLRDHQAPSGVLGTFQNDFAVYGRAGRSCPGCTCRLEVTGGIRRSVLGGRTTYHCPQRQRR